MKVRIDEIKVVEKKRIRKENGDLSILMRSMSKYGLLQPIILDKNNNLLAGYRRLLSAKQLGWSNIDAVIIDARDKISKIEIEIDENLARKDFTYDEIDNAYEIKDKMSNPSLFVRIINFFKNLFIKKR
ncbi:MAG TPA: ParB N-terminal domain-containing protein [Spirochaetota bacterium]|nr:ParB N-terminal domain-containing protein [Spirochaetota bacterium]